ncbi:MAG: DNA primase [endosymbiont of Galathealinum brachiosum]|uniref:DNA primase n=1 Tax=endosymbiont of Galathealinum brachiosum TaxID=2200906 RepID=A0A370DF38_9GAMM|nr:MAG: DNA primase [endosymbiont of Galathealinum brachiosum]
MAGRIPQQFIDDLINRADIVDVVDSRVALKKRGKEYIACCPFHNEKSPSFTVSQNKQFYHCFGCGAHGTALGFIMEYERLDFVDAIDVLAAEYHVDVPREQGNFTAQQDDKKPLYEILEKAAIRFSNELKTTPRAVEYLKQRGLSGEIAKDFQMGYAPDSWDFTSGHLGTDNEGKAACLKSGLTIEKNPQKQYDRFRDRIMFPIRDRRGRTIGFGGRILDKGEPKYLNSPETPVFHKGEELYGLYEARQSVKDLNRIVIVEGYMDVVALAQHGIKYAVATLGTATSGTQISKLFRIVPELIFCYDGDAAGKKAAWRALENSLSVLRDGVQARFLFLPDGEDPDTLVRQEGQQAFEQRLSNATPLADFMLQHLSEDLDLSSADGCGRLSEKAKPLISKIADGVFKDLLLNQLSKLIGLSTSNLQHHIPETGSQPEHTHQINNRKPASSKYQISMTPTRLAIALLLQFPVLAKECDIPNELQASDLPGINLLIKIHQTILQTETCSPSVLVERWRNTDDAAVINKLMQLDIPDSNKETQLTSLNDAFGNLLKKHRGLRLEELLNKSRSTELSAEEKTELSNLYQN